MSFLVGATTYIDSNSSPRDSWATLTRTRCQEPPDGIRNRDRVVIVNVSRIGSPPNCVIANLTFREFLSCSAITPKHTVSIATLYLMKSYF